MAKGSPENEPWQTHLDKVRDEFDALAERYGGHFGDDAKTGASVLFKLRSQIAASLIDPTTGCLLDCACGSGEITENVVRATSFQEVWVNDVSDRMLEKARHRLAPYRDHPKFVWLNSDVFALDRDDMRGRFDVVLCLGLLAHSGRLTELLALFRGLLRAGGSLILQSSLLNHPGSRLIKIVTDRRHAVGGRYKVVFYTLEQILNAAVECGFDVEQVRRFGVCIPFGDRLLGKGNHFIEQHCARRMRSFGGDAVLRLRRVGR